MSSKLVRDWNPVLNGDTYCSPSCGRKCKKSAYDKALVDASKLVLTMGLGWSYKVWENCDWHYRVYKENVSIDIEIYYNKQTDDYTCYFNSNPQFITGHKDPKIAYEMAIEKVNSYLEELQTIQKELAV